MATMTMASQSAYQHLRARLFEEQESLARRIRGLAGGVTIERSADSMDEIQAYQSRDLAAGELGILRRRAADVECAIARWSLGCFGACVVCDEPIKPARLEAMPWVAACVSCQESRERAEETQRAGFIGGEE